MADEKPKRKLSRVEQLSRKEALWKLAAQFGTIDNIPDDLVAARGKEIVALHDGTKVTNETLTEAINEAMKDPELRDEIAELLSERPKPKKVEPKKGGSDKKDAEQKKEGEPKHEDKKDSEAKK